jgi:hypothetical protein
MRQKLITATKFIASIPLAWIGGNLVFGILASGTWIFATLFQFVPEWVFDMVAITFIWICRLGVLVALLIGWVFERKHPSNPQPMPPSVNN